MVGKSLSPWTIWQVVQAAAGEIGVERFARTIFAAHAPSSAAKAAGIWNRSSVCSATHPSRPPNTTSAPNRSSAS